MMTVTRYQEPIDSVEKLVESNLIWGGASWDWLFFLECIFFFKVFIIFLKNIFRIFSVAQSDYPPHKKYVSEYVVKTFPELHKLVKQQKIAITLETMQNGILSYQPYFDKEDSKFLMLMKHPLYW